MAQLLVRNLDEGIVARLKARAAANGRSAEAEHREILAAALDDGAERRARMEAFRRRANALAAEIAAWQTENGVVDNTPSEALQREGRDER